MTATPLAWFRRNPGWKPNTERNPSINVPGLNAPPAPIHYLVDHNDDPALSYERASHEDNQLELLREGLQRLDARSRDIIRRRWLDADSKVTLQELADEYGVSAERIRQIEANALKKMKALFAA